MRKFLSDNITFEVIIKYLDGTASDLEIKSVDIWLLDNQNRTFFNKIREIFSNPDDLKALSSDAVATDWKLLMKRIGKGESFNFKFDATAGIWYQKTWLRIAAVLIVIIMMGGLFLYQRSHFLMSDKIVYNEIIIPFGQKSQLILSDGTKIWINAGTKLRFPNRFNSKIREIWLNGEAFFEVAKDPTKPFYVRTNDISIRALGTSFNVKAYDDEGVVEATLVTGKISIEKNNARGEKQVIIEPNHKAIFIRNESTLENKKSLVAEDMQRQVSEPLEPHKIFISLPVKIEPVVSWTEDRLVFEDEPFENIAKQLERRFGVQIIIENEALKKFRYTGVLKKISFEQTIKAIQLTTRFTYTIQDNKITITNENKKDAN
jgi:transmembrane sensor